LSILFRYTPKDVRFIFIDPKMLELTAYADIPHLLLPVVTEARDAAVALRWAVGEMERRNRIMSAASVPNITEFNQFVRKRKDSPEGKAALKQITKSFTGVKREQIFAHENEELEELPYIAIVIDELSDLMMVAGKQVESSIARLAQMARAAGIHMIIATQNPTIKVVTGIIKANMPSRISFKVRTMQDSRVILDQNGADDLLGYGDMLFLGPGSSKLKRIHGAFVTTEERNRVVDYLRGQGQPAYNRDIMATLEAGDDEGAENGGSSGDPKDELYDQAVTIAVARGKISTSALQRELGIGYNKAAVLMSRMEREGVVGPPEAAGKPRTVLRSR
jgi:S-DNA-T family DNA segregation ATPase FtsK/SpoIIIE